ncbi:glycosyltransferase involved in cell wall biosynthesis [Paenibacillus forsythiae]|uniref:Glycosyltransferase involved in cell wall biosynthesis n=1 Tax=Paenibacillus forsythiae TaxID=365616 RepID=A0ABU3HCA8_9BACL|nr:glycosyltransferase [Paenibacillus forsythiae]MDT3428101.1 glycosyltransferase involved in cell wall biosynthesis [Paenibacillus forsythiae]
MSEVKSYFFKRLYRFAVVLKPIIVKIMPFSARQHIKHRILRSAFPIDNKQTERVLSENFSGINLIGYVRAEMGIGESCRIAAKSISTAEIPFGIINFMGTNPASMNDRSWVHKEISEPKYNVNIFHINAEQMMEIYAHHGNSLFKNRYNIGFWHWELPDFPDEWKESFRLVDEIWVPSTFVADSIAMKSPVPVVKIPHSIEVTINEIRERSYFNLPKEPFLFLTMYDLKSYQERKNPQAAVRAFKQVFLPDDLNVGLVIKVNSSHHSSEDITELNQLIGNYQNIYLIKKTLSRNDTNALLSVTDCYISLHRSEGFGLGLAEAMYLGKPAIGTNWSSNIDFMNPGNSCPVDYRLIRLNHDHGPYKSYQYWADPDIEHASEYMLKLYNDRNFYNEISLEGERYIKDHLSPHAVGETIKKRLNYISLWNFGG